MSARAIGSATIAFGMVSIPVKLYTSTEASKYISFNQLHKECSARLKQQLVCPQHGPVERDDIVKGYEYARGQYVVFTPEELKALEEEATYSIDIAEFVPAQAVDRVYLDKVYYLGPDRGGARAYRLLSEALQETGRAALAQYAARGKQYLVLVRPAQSGLVMEQLRYAEEVRSFSEVPIEEIEVKKTELDLAVQLVEQAASNEFHPERYQDAVRKRVLELIERKVAGEEITVEPAAQPAGAKVIDLMEALKASLESQGASGRKPARRAAKAKSTEQKPTAKKKARSRK
jgi:DNA end-binding protein Ku